MHACLYCGDDSLGNEIIYYNEENKPIRVDACLSCIRSGGIYCEVHSQIHLVKMKQSGKNLYHACPGCKHEEVLSLEEQRRRELITFIETHKPSLIFECLEQPFSVPGGTLSEQQTVLTKLLLIAELAGYTLETALAQQVAGRSGATLQ